MTTTAREIADAYRLHLILTGRSKADHVEGMTFKADKEKFKDCEKQEGRSHE
jgi:6-phosphogluconolactonase/glucosamine-6-phosphate isomerase/deaminase